jgi:CBS domain-containing protein
MAIYPGVKGGDILAWRGVSELVTGLQEQIARRMISLLPGEEIELLRRVQGRFDEELAVEERFAAEFARLAGGLKQAEYEDELPRLHDRFTQLAADYFRERGSVLGLHSLCSGFRDELVRKALHFAEQVTEAGARPGPYCWLSGEAAGRGEQSLRVNADYFLIYRDTGEDAARRFERFSYQAVAILERCGLMTPGQRTAAVKKLWRGSVDDWQRWLDKEFSREGEPRFSIICRLADLRSLHGDGVLSAEVAELSRERLKQETAAASFRLLAKKAVGMPVALGMFGGFRVERSGAHKGCFNLDRLAVDPLVMNIRVFSIASELSATGTVDRIKQLLEGGRLDVNLTERLLMAFHEFGRHQIRLEMAAKGGNGGLFLDPDELTEPDQEKLKNGLEAVVNLQKIIFQLFLEYL